MTGPLFPFVNYWWLYLAFTGLVVLLLSIDLRLHRQGPDSMARAALWTGVWVALALAFCGLLYWFTSGRLTPELGRQAGLEFLAGYILEKALSVDNMFVFALVFRYFGIPAAYQHRVLFYGVLGAMALRGLFISAGSALVRFEWAMIAFGVFLIVTGLRLIFEGEKQVNPSESRIIRGVCRLLPVTREFHGPRFFARVRGRLHATPLLIVLLFLESTDVMFAIDSVPAVFGVTREPFIVYSSNIFAILGLRSLFCLLSGALERFHTLKFGLAAVLVFVGLKMVWLDHLAGGRFPIGISLGIIAAAIGTSIGLSLLDLRSVVQLARRIPMPRAAELALGVIFFGLAAVAISYATEAIPGFFPLPGLAAVGAKALYLSAFCYIVCGTVLLWPAGRRQK